MLLRFYLNEKGERIYTLKQAVTVNDESIITYSAHPARFTPEDKYSEQRIMIKKRFKILPTQKGPQSY